jgi:hypothetical protein
VDAYVLVLIAPIVLMYSRALLNLSRAAVNFVKAYRLAVGKTTRKSRRRK